MLIFLTVPSGFANDFTVDRPSVGTSASTIGKGIVQLETGVQMAFTGLTSVSSPTLLRFGVAESTEIRLFSDVATISDSVQFGPLGIEGKQRIYQSDSVTFGLLANGIIPMRGDPSVATALGLLDYSSGLWSYWLNVGGSVESFENPQWSTVFAIGAGVNVVDSVQVCAEQSGTLSDSFSGYTQFSVLYTTTERQWDIYYQASLQDLSEHLVGIGYSQRWALKPSEEEQQ